MTQSNLMNLCKDFYPTFPYLLSLKELQEMLGIGKSLAYKMIKNGEIKAVKIGREYKFAKSDILAYCIEKGLFNGEV